MTALTSPWALACLGTYAVLLVVALAANHGAHRKPSPAPDDIRQPDVRDWLCSDGYYRTEAEAVIWVEVTPGSNAWHQPAADAEWLPDWINDHNNAPLYVPREWVA